MPQTDSQALQMKKLTLTAWAQMLFKQGIIDSARLWRMITLIERMRETDIQSVKDS